MDIFTVFGNNESESYLSFPLCVKYFIQWDELGEIAISGITEKYSDAQQILAEIALS